MAELLTFGCLDNTPNGNGSREEVCAVLGSVMLKEEFPKLPIEVIAQVAYPSMSWVTLAYLRSFTPAVVKIAESHATRMGYDLKSIQADVTDSVSSRRGAIEKLTEQDIRQYAF